MQLIAGVAVKVDNAVQALPFLGSLAGRSGISQRALGRGLLVTLLLWMFFGGGLRWLGLLIGLFYPCIKTFKLITKLDRGNGGGPGGAAAGSLDFPPASEESNGMDPKDLSVLKYWVVFSAFMAVSSVADMFLWLLLGWGEIMKIMFLLYLQFFRGADFIFDHVVGPWIHKNMPTADKLVREAGNQARGLASTVASQAPALAVQSLQYASTALGGMSGGSNGFSGAPAAFGASPFASAPPMMGGAGGMGAGAPAGPTWVGTSGGANLARPV